MDVLGNRKLVPFLAACGVFPVLWFCRSAVYEGDGDQISRFIEAGYWFVRTEILSQAVFQVAYRICSAWGWDGLLAMNLVSCLAGSVLVYFLVRIGAEFVGTLYAALLVFCSGLIVLCAGHTEYYTQLLAAVAAWNWFSIQYLRGQCSLLASSLLFSLGAWLHQEVLFALPAQILLPFLRNEPDQWVLWIVGLVPLGFLFIVRFLPQFSPLHLEGMGHGWNTVPLWTAEGTDKLYSMFEWAHWRDVLYALGRRSILAWPIITLALIFTRGTTFTGANSLVLGFLWTQDISFWVLCILWHPNLGIQADWDLFAVEAVPSTILALIFLPKILLCRVWPFLVVCMLCFSGLANWEYIIGRAQLGHRGRGAIEIQIDPSEDVAVKLDGHQKPFTINSVLQGRHEVRLIHREEKWAKRYQVMVAPNHTLRLVVNPVRDVHPTPFPGASPVARYEARGASQVALTGITGPV